MADKKYFINDNFVISDEVMKMTHEERRAEIARLEKEAREEKARILAAKALKQGN